MSNVPLSKRKKHLYLIFRDFRELKLLLVDFAKNDFGFDLERYMARYQLKISSYSGPNKETYELREWDRANRFYPQFLSQKTVSLCELLDLVEAGLLNVENVLEGANREDGLGMATLPYLYSVVKSLDMILKLLQTVAEVLPCDKNKYSFPTLKINALKEQVQEIINKINTGTLGLLIP